jgi:hypothetical protein
MDDPGRWAVEKAKADAFAQPNDRGDGGAFPYP